MLPIFFLAWIIFNGNITLEIILFGVVISAAMFAFICNFMDYSLKKELLFYRKLPLFCCYILILIQEVILANLTVFRMILTRKEVMEPVLVHIRTDLKHETSRVMLANAITLTPGTITVSLTGNDLLVHCLDETLSEGMEDSRLVSLLRKLEELEEKAWN